MAFAMGQLKALGESGQVGGGYAMGGRAKGVRIEEMEIGIHGECWISVFIGFCDLTGIGRAHWGDGKVQRIFECSLVKPWSTHFIPYGKCLACLANFDLRSLVLHSGSEVSSTVSSFSCSASQNGFNEMGLIDQS